MFRPPASVLTHAELRWVSPLLGLDLVEIYMTVHRRYWGRRPHTSDVSLKIRCHDTRGPHCVATGLRSGAALADILDALWEHIIPELT